MTLGIQSIQVNSTNTDPEFKEYIATFEQLSGKKVTTPINFGYENDDNVIGVCFRYLNGLKEIKIKKSYWTSKGYANREQLILHELGHCENGLGHDDNEIILNKIPVPETLMNSHIIDSYTYTTFRDYYLKEFQKRLLTNQ